MSLDTLLAQWFLRSSLPDCGFRKAWPRLAIFSAVRHGLITRVAGGPLGVAPFQSLRVIGESNYEEIVIYIILECIYIIFSSIYFFCLYDRQRRLEGINFNRQEIYRCYLRSTLERYVSFDATTGDLSPFSDSRSHDCEGNSHLTLHKWLQLEQLCVSILDRAMFYHLSCWR